MWSRSNPMGLLVALGDSAQATGTLFWDDGESLNTFQNSNYFLASFTAGNNQLHSQIVHVGYAGVNALHFATVRVFGVVPDVTTVTVGGAVHTSFNFNPTTRELSIFNFNRPLTTDINIAWS